MFQIEFWGDREHGETSSSTWCRRPWGWSPACVWSGTTASCCGSPGWMAAALAWRWRIERAAVGSTSRPRTPGSDHGPASGGRGNSGPGDEHRGRIRRHLWNVMASNADDLWALPGSRTSCRAGSGSDSRSFSPGRPSSLEGCSLGRGSSRCCWSPLSSAHLQEKNQSITCVFL